MPRHPTERSELASAMRAAVVIVGECQPRSISPRYFASIRPRRRATSSRVSRRPCRTRRTAAPNGWAVGQQLAARGL